MSDIQYNIEVTDTFGGQANYDWVRRAQIDVSDGISDLALVRKAKKAVGLNGVRGRVERYGETAEFRPYGACIVMFITPEI